MSKNRPALFRGRHFQDEIIVLCVRWYLRYSLSYRDVQELMAERGLSVDHSPVWRWVQRYAPILNQRIRREVRHPNRAWRIDETISGWLDDGCTCIEQWIRVEKPLSSCSRPNGIWSRPSTSSSAEGCSESPLSRIRDLRFPATGE